MGAWIHPRDMTAEHVESFLNTRRRKHGAVLAPFERSGPLVDLLKMAE